jgi:hypothetical protein
MIPDPKEPTLADLLTASGGTFRHISLPDEDDQKRVHFEAPILKLYCNGKECQGERFAYPVHDSDYESIYTIYKSGADFSFKYSCRNCGKYLKTFAVIIAKDAEGEWMGCKYGEYPQHSIQTPARLRTLLGGNADIYFKGRQCEIHGQGIGAFAYYRRVVEVTKNDIIDLILGVVPETGHEPLKQELTNAKNESQFSTAVTSIKHALPDLLLIAGQNPLTILHGKLSEGIHELSDEECLLSAEAVRVVLEALVQRAASIRKQEAEVRRKLSELGKRGD